MASAKAKAVVYVIGLLVALLCLSAAAFAQEKAKVGILEIPGAAQAKVFSTFVQKLGYEPVVIPVDKLSAEALAGIPCLMVDFSNAYLTADEYKVIRQYAKDGGNLFLLGMAGYWVVETKEPDARKRMYGPKKDGIKANTFCDIGGAKWTNPYGGVLVRVKSQAVHPLTKGVAETVDLPLRAGRTDSGCGTAILAATTATVLIKCDAFQNKPKPDPENPEKMKVQLDTEKAETSDLLMLYEPPEHKGKVVWLASESYASPILQDIWRNVLSYLTK